MSSYTIYRNNVKEKYFNLDQINLNKYQNKLYSVQLKSFPVDEFEKGIAFYDSLNRTDYLAYYYTTWIDRKKWLRIRIGYFLNIDEATLFGEKIKKEKGIDYFVTKSDEIEVFKINTKYTFIYTPSSIFLKDGDQIKEIYSIDFKNYFDKYQMYYNPEPQISRDKNKFAFYFDSKLMIYDIRKNKLDILFELNHDQGASFKFSDDGRYLAFIIKKGIDTPNTLGVIDIDNNSRNNILDLEENSGLQVKQFNWLPKENKLLYSLGDAWPTGGKNIFITDLSDKGKSLIKMEVENKMYILDYELNNNELVLKIIYFDQGYYSANTKRVYINYKELNKELTIKRDVFLR